MSQTHMKPDRGSPPSTPRWVKVFGMIIVILVVLFVIMHFTGTGFGPGMHTPRGGTGDMPPVTLVTHRPMSLVGHTAPIEYGVQQPLL
ncbi:MAG: hypothetical protein ACR2M0_16735 [Chloroflexia bacterium]